MEYELGLRGVKFNETENNYDVVEIITVFFKFPINIG